jgi:hypothetical protein
MHRSSFGRFNYHVIRDANKTVTKYFRDKIKSRLFFPPPVTINAFIKGLPL